MTWRGGITAKGGGLLIFHLAEERLSRWSIVDRVTAGLLAALVCAALSPRAAAAHDVYLMNDNHTDYGWNATTEAYDRAMLAEIDYYLDQIDATAERPSEGQARFAADSWWYLYNYEKNRPPEQFLRLIEAIKSGHVTVPLNPFVTLYGALPTEAAIRAGYYPGRIERRYGVSFRMAQDIENQTSPWGLASLWAGSGARYSWKGICGCATQAPFRDRKTELFRWQGPDGKALLMKWYQLLGGDDWGSYAEARKNLSAPRVEEAIERTRRRQPGIPLTGLFGAGQDQVEYRTTAFTDLAREWNGTHRGGDRVVVSNGIDFFEVLEEHADRLPVLRGGWGNDWDLWPATLSRRTAQMRRAIERLRTAEALSAIAHWRDETFWPPIQERLEAAFIDYFKYFEHSWGRVTDALFEALIENKKRWARSFDDAVSEAEASAASRVAGLFATPDEDRVVVFNPLGFARTDFADVPVPDAGPHVVRDVATGEEAPSQTVSLGGKRHLRLLARDVPALGYRVYRYQRGTPARSPDAAEITSRRIESHRYRVELGGAGEIVAAFDKDAGREIAAGALNDFGGGSVRAVAAENVGPVSATLRVEVEGPPRRRVGITLFREIDRIEIENEILENVVERHHYRYRVALSEPRIRFEEVGAIARPGLVSEGGDFLPGTRSDYMTLNHFVGFAGNGYGVVLSNRDAFAMRVGDSTAKEFDLPTSEVSVLALGNLAFEKGIQDQGGDDRFLNSFAVIGEAGAFSAARAMRHGLAHQNPLRVIPLARNQPGSLREPTASFVSLDVDNVVVTAIKPAEEGGRGIIVRVWELDGRDTDFTIDVSAFAPREAFAVSLIETDIGPAALNNGRIAATIGANEIKTYRFLPTPARRD